MKIWTIQAKRELRLLLGISAIAIAILTDNTALASGASTAEQSVSNEVETYIVQGVSAASAMHEVLENGGTIVSKIQVIDAVGAKLTRAQLAKLELRPGLRIYENRSVQTDGRKRKPKREPRSHEASEPVITLESAATTEPAAAEATPEEPANSTATTESEPLEFQRTTASDGFLQWTELQRLMDIVPYEHPILVNAPAVHQGLVTGAGVTVAVIDTGLWWEADTMLAKSPIARFDVTGQDVADDPHGHGTHVASIIASDQYAANFVKEGIAPGSRILAIRAFDYDGGGNYLDVIEAIDLVIRHRNKFNVRVMNLSFSAPPQSYYWDDPLNQAVMAAWKAGIVVVASAGNSGPDPMTIGVPGNVPYVITVGAMSDNFSSVDPSDDPLTSFSSAGPTYEGFVKPEVVAPGGHVVSSMPFDSYIGINHPDSMLTTERHFAMSGTSQSAAIVSGVVALMLEADPTLTPDDVKCRLMSTARPAVDDAGNLAYSIFQQGSGMVDALAAVQSASSGCANVGLDIARDLLGQQHYSGGANMDADGNYYIMDENGDPLDADGYVWSRAYLWGRGYIWSQAYTWSMSYMWSQAYTWSRSYMWSQSISWQDGALFSDGLAEPMGVNHWVDQE